MILSKRLSVIIVSWNCRKPLDACLSSLDALGLKDMETVVVDSNSHDGTVEFLKDLEASERGRRLGLTVHYSPTNIGWSKGMEEGARISSGRWLLSCNPDIVFTEDFKEMLYYAESHDFLVLAPRLVTPKGVLHGCLRRITMTRLFFVFTILGQSLDRKIGRGFISGDFHYGSVVFDRPALVDHPSASFFLMQRDLLSRLGGYLLSNNFPMYFGDSDLFCRLQEQHIPVVFLPSIRILHDSSYSRKLVATHVYQSRMVQSMVRYAKKWKLHHRFLVFLLFVDAVFAPFVSFPHTIRPPRHRDILESAYRLKGIIDA